MMTDIFNNPAKPFYRFGDIMILQKIEKQKWVQFICDGFAVINKHIDKKIAEKIPLLMKNHSWYVQQLSHYIWNLTENEATTTEFNTGLKELINANYPLYQKEVENLSQTQLNLLKAVSKSETQFTSTLVMQIYALGTPRNVSKNKSILINTDIIHEIDGKYEFVDPAFELWFNKSYFKQNYTVA